MGNSGNGDAVLANSGKAPTGGNSQPSQQTNKHNTRSAKDEQFGASAALEFVDSSLSYCIKAGLRVEYVNRDDSLVLVIYGARYDAASTGTKVVPIAAKE